MTDATLARETEEKIKAHLRLAGYGITAPMEETFTALILAAFAQRDAAVIAAGRKLLAHWDKHDGHLLSHFGHTVNKDVQELRSAIDAARAGTSPLEETFAYLESPSDQASRAVPITTEMQPLFDNASGKCWLWDSCPWKYDPNIVGTPRWDRLGHRFYLSLSPKIRAEYTHYHPDQETPPTCRPTV